MQSKIFGIGFHKTGTTSLGAALKTLGYRVTGPNAVNDPCIGDNVLSIAHDLVPEFDAFQDNPWPIIYREMDSRCPGSKFILTVRDTDAWIKSQVKHFGRKETPMRKWIYGAGCPEGNEAIYINKYQAHNEQVKKYFEDRPQDLLIMDFGRGDGWSALCSFLGNDIPADDFPHANKADDRKRKKRKSVSALGRLSTFLNPARNACNCSLTPGMASIG